MNEDANISTTVSGHARLTTLSLVDEANLSKRPPAYDPEKGVANHKKFLSYVRNAYEGADAQALVEAGFGEVSDAELGEVWHRYIVQIIGVDAIKDGSAVVLKPAEGVSDARYMLIDLVNRVTAAKTGVRVNRYSKADTVEICNATEMLAMRTIREDFKAHVHLAGVGESAEDSGLSAGSNTDTASIASVLSEVDINKFFAKSLGDSRLLAPTKIKDNFPLTYERANMLSPAGKDIVAAALGMEPGSFAPYLREGLQISDVLDEATPQQLAAVIAAMEADGSVLSKHFVSNIKRTILARSYNDFMRSTMERIQDVQQQRRYERDISERDSATVYQEKKYIPESHLEAAAQSVFMKSGDFAHVEIDESVELSLMKQIEDEWAILREALPHSEVKAALRFRKTGRHRAAGVYHPTKLNIAVDPRHPYSFVHEYFHHLDYTLGAAGGADADTKQLSLSEGFSELLHGVQRKMRSTPGIDKMDYYTTPTEVFARGAELVCYWSGLATSLNGDAAKYDSPVYRSYEPYREQLIEWYNQHLGLDIAHDRAVGVDTPATAGEKPIFEELGAAPQPVVPSIDELGDSIFTHAPAHEQDFGL